MKISDETLLDPAVPWTNNTKREARSHAGHRRERNATGQRRQPGSAIGKHGTRCSGTAGAGRAITVKLQQLPHKRVF